MRWRSLDSLGGVDCEFGAPPAADGLGGERVRRQAPIDGRQGGLAEQLTADGVVLTSRRRGDQE